MSTTLSIPSARLGATHGYVVDGDVAQLHADLEFAESAASRNWALQLWACDAPYAGGPIAGIKIAEASLTGGLGNGPRHAATPALVPGGPRDFAMVLVLASGESGLYDQVHDFANYPSRQAFATPYFDGPVGYRIEGDHVVIEAEAVRNPRADDNLSGTLSLEICAVAAPYRGGSVDGHTMGRVEIGRLAGQQTLAPIGESVRLSMPPAGSFEVVLLLREWAADAGYVTRDYARFDIPFVVEAPAPAQTPAPATTIAPTAKAKATATATATPVANVRKGGVSVNRATVAELAAVKGAEPPGRRSHRQGPSV